MTAWPMACSRCVLPRPTPRGTAGCTDPDAPRPPGRPCGRIDRWVRRRTCRTGNGRPGSLDVRRAGLRRGCPPRLGDARPEADGEVTLRGLLESRTDGGQVFSLEPPEVSGTSRTIWDAHRSLRTIGLIQYLKSDGCTESRRPRGCCPEDPSSGLSKRVGGVL